MSSEREQAAERVAATYGWDAGQDGFTDLDHGRPAKAADLTDVLITIEVENARLRAANREQREAGFRAAKEQADRLADKLWRENVNSRPVRTALHALRRAIRAMTDKEPQ